MKPKPKKQTESRAVKELSAEIDRLLNENIKLWRDVTSLEVRMVSQERNVVIKGSPDWYKLLRRVEDVETKLNYWTTPRMQNLTGKLTGTPEDYKPKETPTAPPPRKPYINADGSVNWELVPVDTKVLVSEDYGVFKECNDLVRAHFAMYEHGKIYTFRAGSTSWTANGDLIRWKYAKLAE